MGRLGSHTFAYLDVETTGLSAWFGDRICEIAVLRCQDDVVAGSFESLVNPERPISPGAARVNGLRDSDLAAAPLFGEIAEQLLALTTDAVIVCHNVPFDLGFLSSELSRLHRQLPSVLALDTLEIARAYFNFGSNSLQSIARDLRIEVGTAHRALGDAFTTREVLACFSQKLRSIDIERSILPYYPPDTRSEELILPPAVQEALQSHRRLFIRYVDRKGDASDRWVTPKQVRALNDYVYLVAYCHLRDEERSFRLDRIERMDIEL